MKVLILVNKIPYPPKDGGSIATFNIAKGMADNGHSIELLCMNTSKHFVIQPELPEELKSGINLSTVNVEAKISKSGAVSNLLFSKLPYSASRFLDENFSQKIQEILRNKKIDIVQLEGLYMGLYIPLIRRNSKASIVLRSHNIEHFIWRRISKNEKNPIKKWYLKNLSKRILNLKNQIINTYDLLVPITEYDAKIYNELGNNKSIFISQTGIDFSGITTQTKLGEFPSIFQIGALDWAPNQEGLNWFFKNCWNQILEKHPNIKFYIAGRNIPEWFLNNLRSVRNLIYLGEVENAHKFILSKSIMLVPLLSGSGMRIKIIEGMALGRPIITTSIGTEGIPTTHNENILIADTANDFIVQCIRLIENKQLAETLSINARKFAEKNFDNRKITAKLAYFYQKSLSLESTQH